MQKIIIFASGLGSNAQNIVEYFKEHSTVKVVAIWSNKSSAKVLQKAQKLHIPTKVFSKAEMQSAAFIKALKQKANYIILAGFLLKVPKNIIAHFKNKIINIHPSLLPKYGGAGMYGMNVHKAVKHNKETQTGITIHFVNENYDEGAIICQIKTDISPEDNVEDIAEKIHLLEHLHFPKIIEQVIDKN